MAGTKEPTPPRVKEIFLEACDLPTGQRGALLDARCGEDLALRAGVQALLDAHDRAGEFLAGPTLGQSTIPPADSARAIRQQIGPYKLLRVIGEGGFGTVYLAEQEFPIRRRVALKLIKPGMDSGQVIARFEAERQALALMDHPNIAKVFDAGATENGRPYFVMELVEGVPITRWCDDNRMTARQRLELFTVVCQAVQHAHQKGIIHRDIKPSNVLVTLQDGKSVPKVIDFGIAKATQARLTEKTVFTEMRQLIGTPEYMSPEQADIGAIDIDTRADIYSLGVLLYELLTGATPFDPRDLRSKAYAEIQRVIREVDPPRPSTKLSTIDTLPSVAAQRSVEPEKLRRLVRGELDWIVMKCLEKDRSRRYATASAMAADIENFLSDQPVLAGPPSARYRLRKFIRRNRAAVFAGCAILIVLIAGILGTTIGLIRASRQRTIADQQRAEADRQRADAQRNAQEATKQAAIAQAVSDFQSDMLASADPERLMGDKVTVLQAVTAAVKELDAGKLKDHPLVEANVRETIGNTLRGLGRLDQAEPNLRKALELRRQVLGDSAPEVAQSLSNLAWLLHERGQYAQAEQLVRQAVEIFRRSGDQPNTAATIGGVAVMLEEQAKLSEAEQMYRESLAIRRKILPAGDKDIGRNLHNLASVLLEEGRYDESEQTFREALQISRKALPAGHPAIATDVNNLAMLMEMSGRPAESETLFREALQMRRNALPAGHPEIAASLINLSGPLRDVGKFEESERLAREGLEMYRHSVSPGHPRIGSAANTLAKVLQAEKKFPEAEALYREAIEIFEAKFGKDHASVGMNRLGLGQILGQTNRLPEAEIELLEAERVLAIAQGAPKRAHEQCYEALVAVYAQREEAEPGKGYGRKSMQWKSRLPGTQPTTKTSNPASTTRALSQR